MANKVCRICNELPLLSAAEQHILVWKEMLALLVKNREKFEQVCLRIRIAVTLLALLSAAGALGAVALRLSPAAAADEGIKLPVLMYHAIMSDPARSGDYVITPEAFRRDMEYIRDAGYETVVMEDIIAYVRSGAPLPEKPVMVTLDDGYYNNYLYAYPVLSELGMRAVLSVIGVEADRYTAEPDLHENYAHCTWDMLREMEESGVIELQNHSYDLHHIQKGYMGIGKKTGEELVAYRARLYTDLSRMQNRFCEELGFVPSTFTYPFGCAPADSAVVLEELGFQASLGTEGLTFYVTRDAECLERIPRYNRTSAKSARSILESA